MWRSPTASRPGPAGIRWPRSLRAYAFPRIGAVPVSDVTTADVLATPTPIWHDKPETARRVRQRIGALLHESSRARAMPIGRILTCRCDTTLGGRGRSSH